MNVNKNTLKSIAALLVFFLATLTSEAVRRFDTVVIDAGHGGKDPGATRGKVREADLALTVALRVEKLLKARGVRVVMTRRRDKFVTLPRRSWLANRQKRPIFVSIHFNAAKDRSVHGAETFYKHTQDKALAYEIQRQMLSHAKMRDRKIRKRSFRVLKYTKCPAVLVECGFLSHPGQLKMSQTAYRQRRLAEAIVKGIMEYRD